VFVRWKNGFYSFRSFWDGYEIATGKDEMMDYEDDEEMDFIAHLVTRNSLLDQMTGQKVVSSCHIMTSK
jgi:hypothetical protein